MVNVQSPPEGRAIDFVVFLIDGAIPPDEWPGRDSMGTQSVGAYALPSGSRVQVVWWEIAMPDLGPLQGPAYFYRGRSIDDLRSNPGVGMLVFADEPDGSKAIYDCAAKYRS